MVVAINLNIAAVLVIITVAVEITAVMAVRQEITATARRAVTAFSVVLPSAVTERALATVLRKQRA